MLGSDSFSAVVMEGGTASLLTGDDWDGNGIAWESDVKEKFKNGAANPTKETDVGPGGFALPKHTNEEFIVWMRTAGLPTFKKLHRIIRKKVLAAGSWLNVTINNSKLYVYIAMSCEVQIHCQHKHTHSLALSRVLSSIRLPCL